MGISYTIKIASFWWIEAQCHSEMLPRHMFVHMSTSSEYLHWPWRCHSMEVSSVLLSLCERNLSGSPHEEPVIQSCNVILLVGLNKLLNKHLHWWWSRPIPYHSCDITPLLWCHNGRDGVSNHQPHDCLLNRLFRPRSKQTSKLRVAGLCAGNSPGTGEFPTQMASYAENVSNWWHHHAKMDNFTNVHIASWSFGLSLPWFGEIHDNDRDFSCPSQPTSNQWLHWIVMMPTLVTLAAWQLLIMATCNDDKFIILTTVSFQWLSWYFSDNI